MREYLFEPAASGDVRVIVQGGVRGTGHERRLLRVGWTPPAVTVLHETIEGVRLSVSDASLVDAVRGMFGALRGAVRVGDRIDALAEAYLAMIGSPRDVRAELVEIDEDRDVAVFDFHAILPLGDAELAVEGQITADRALSMIGGGVSGRGDGAHLVATLTAARG